MNRRQLIELAVASAIGFSGCSDDDDDGTRTYRFSMDDRSDDDPDREVLDLDTSGLTRGQLSIVREAAEEGSYAEEDVAWSTVPGHRAITMEFKMIVQLVDRHTQSEADFDEETSIRTPSTFDDDPYWTEISIE